MKASTVIAIVAASVVSAQTSNPLTQIPQCALTCAISSLGSTGCQTTDFKCICSNSGFVTSLTPCVEAACTPQELEQTIKAAEGLCSSVGVTLSIPPVGSTSMPATTSTMSTSMMSTSVAPYTTLATTTSVVVVPPPVTNTTTTAVVVSPTANATMSVTTGLPSPTPTGNAANRNTAAFGLGAVLAFAAALL